MTNKKPPTNDPRCGTTAGKKAHERRGEHPCDSCKKAHADDMKFRRQGAA